MSPGILGKKIGMTQVFRTDGQVVPVTLLKAGPCVVVQRKSPLTDGYDAVQLGLMEFVKPARLTKPQRGHLRKAGVEQASHLVVTLPHSLNRAPLIMAARDLNPSLRILVRARYLRERPDLEQAGANAARFEEVEAAVALAELVLHDLGRDDDTVRRETERIRDELA